MDTILKLNDQLMNAPAGVVVALFAIALGYVLKISAFFPNQRIPVVIVCATAILFPAVQFCADKLANAPHAGLHIVINALIGFIVGFMAWAFHAQILKRFVDPKFFNDDGSTKFLSKP